MDHIYDFMCAAGAARFVAVAKERVFTIFTHHFDQLRNGYTHAKRLENFPKRSRPSNLSHSAMVTSGAVAVPSKFDSNPPAFAFKVPVGSLLAPSSLFDVEHGLDHLLHAICTPTCCV